jgi:hypothetical protein
MGAVEESWAMALLKSHTAVAMEIRGTREFDRKNLGAIYEQFVAAKRRPADIRWDVKLGRIEVRA